MADTKRKYIGGESKEVHRNQGRTQEPPGVEWWWNAP
jgi:hypothetical protein